MPRTTIADVAQAAGVSVSTVSRALRGLDRVSPETRERIEQEAKRLHFSFRKARRPCVRQNHASRRAAAERNQQLVQRPRSKAFTR